MKKRMRSTKGMSIRAKMIVVTGLLLLIPLFVMGGVSYVVAKGELEESGKILLKNSVEMTLQVIDQKQRLVEEGKLTLEEAQESVREYMLGEKKADGTRSINTNFNLGKSGYLLAYTQEGVEAAHPSLEGKKVMDTKDKKTGSLFVQEQIKIGNSGGGYLTYTWTLPNSEKTSDKITYQKTDPNWKWVVSSGTYMSDFNQGSTTILKDMLLILVSVTLLGSIVIVVFAQHIAVPINRIGKAVDAVASGDLTLRELNIKNRDEVGRLAESFKAMVKNMNELIGSVKESAVIVLKSSEELDAIVDENTASINEVAASVEEIAKSSSAQAMDAENGVARVRELAERIELVTGLTLKTNEAAATTAEVGGRGLQSIKLLEMKSEENSAAADRANNVIMEVDKNSVEIGSITEAIGQIAEQTNLLALNAAIEAARAGEQGRGFAVVAEEVRKLASQSNVSASKVRELIAGIQDKSRTAVQSMQEGKLLAKEQSRAVLEAKEIFMEIIQSIERIASDMEQIKSYSIDMEKQKNEIVEVFETLSASTEENSAATEEVSATSEQQLQSIEQIVTNTQNLKILAEKLSERVDRFQV